MNASGVIEELGLTVERSTQLERITQNIMDKSSEGSGYGRISHVILSIVSRKDLSDLEKTICAYIFCSKTKFVDDDHGDGEEVPDMPRIIDTRDKSGTVRLDGKKNIINFDMGPIVGGPMIGGPIMGNTEKGEHIVGFSGRIITPPEVDPKELSYIIVSMLISLLGQLPKDDAKDFCKNMSITFMKMAMTGDMKL